MQPLSARLLQALYPLLEEDMTAIAKHEVEHRNTLAVLRQVVAGALDPKRLADYRRRYDESPPGSEMQFLYGSHYSCPGYVIGFHLRNDP